MNENKNEIIAKNISENKEYYKMKEKRERQKQKQRYNKLIMKASIRIQYLSLIHAFSYKYTHSNIPNYRHTDRQKTNKQTNANTQTNNLRDREKQTHQTSVNHHQLHQQRTVNERNNKPA